MPWPCPLLVFAAQFSSWDRVPKLSPNCPGRSRPQAYDAGRPAVTAAHWVTAAAGGSWEGDSSPPGPHTGTSRLRRAKSSLRSLGGPRPPALSPPQGPAAAPGQAAALTAPRQPGGGGRRPAHPKDPAGRSCRGPRGGRDGGGLCGLTPASRGPSTPRGSEQTAPGSHPSCTLPFPTWKGAMVAAGSPTPPLWSLLDRGHLPGSLSAAVRRHLSLSTEGT